MSEVQDERQEVETYLRKHKLQSIIGTAINNTVSVRPDHPLELFSTLIRDKDAARGIVNIVAREVLISDGTPSLRVTVSTPLGDFTATVAAPERFEDPAAPHDLIDDDEERYGGMGVTKAVNLINETIGPALLGKDPSRQRTIDATLLKFGAGDAKAEFGLNTFLAVRSLPSVSCFIAKLNSLRSCRWLSAGLAQHTRKCRCTATSPTSLASQSPVYQPLSPISSLRE